MSWIEMYLRSPRFAECLQIMLNKGATLDDPLLEALLLDDDIGLRRLLSSETLRRKLDPLYTFTSCRGVTPLHICAEFNSTRCAHVLLDAGIEVNARADEDENGLVGQTPIFHAVNDIYSNIAYLHRKRFHREPPIRNVPNKYLVEGR